MNKKITSILVCFTLFCTLINVCSAHEMYNGYPLRWSNVVYSSYYMHKQLSMYCNGSNLDSTYSNSYNTMLTNWTCNSNGYVAASNSSFSSSKVDFYKHSSWPSEWGDAAACTRHFDKYGNCFQSFGVFDSTLKVAYVSIYTNPAKNSIVSQRNLAALILGHELGHAACLGHPNLPAPASIMTQGQEIWSKPQAHDRSDLASMYQ